MAKPKAEMMRAGRKARKQALEAKGLTVTKTAHVKPEDEARLIKYVVERLGGECPSK